MSFAAALFLAQAVAAPPPPAEANEIVVLGQRLAETRVEWSTRKRGGAMAIRSCRVVKSSGDRELDKVVCQALRECAPHIPLGSGPGDDLPAFFACNEERSMALGLALLEKREQRR